MTDKLKSIDNPQRSSASQMKPINSHQALKSLLTKSRQLEAGFSLIEVVTGIVMMALFTGIAMQGMAVASLLKSSAKQYSAAIAWIQEDLENIKHQAVIYKTTSLSSAAAADTSSISVATANDFEINDKLKIGTDNTTYTISSISGNTLSISPHLTANLAAGAPLVASQSIRCGTSISPSTITTGYADGFRDKITGADISGTSNDYNINKTDSNTGKQFQLRRSTTLANVSPYNVVKIKYTIAEISSNSSYSLPLANLSTELVPSASFLCPR